MKTARLIALLLLVPSLVPAAFSRSDKGTTTAAFLKLGAGARAEAMGEAGAAVVDDASALYWNPAGLLNIDGQSAQFMHAPYIELTYYDFGAYARHTGSFAWGLAWQHFSAGTLRETNPYGEDVGDFSPRDTAFTLGGAIPTSAVPGLREGSLGLNVKYIRSTIIETASAWAMDVGWSLPPQAGGRWRSALVLSNLGTTMRYEQAKEALPMSIRLGQGYAFNDRWTGVLDLVLPRDNAPYAGFGAERKLPLGPRWSAAMRAGYNTRTSADIDGIHGLTLGAGVGLDGFRVDYAFLPMGQLGATHRISLGFQWGQRKNLEPYPQSFQRNSDTAGNLEELLQLSPSSH